MRVVAFGLGTLAFALAACAQTQWVKVRATEAELVADRTACDTQAAAEFPVSMQWIVTLGTANVGGLMVGFPIFTRTDENAGKRAQGMADCMTARGWTRGPAP